MCLLREEISKEDFEKVGKGRLTVPLNLPIDAVKETKIVAPLEAAISSMASSSIVPSRMVTFELLEIISGTLLGFRTKGVKVWLWGDERVRLQKSRPVCLRSVN